MYCWNLGYRVGVETGVGAVGVNRFDWSRSRLNLADYNTSPESQTSIRRQTMILDKRLCTLPKRLKDRKKRRVAVCK